MNVVQPDARASLSTAWRMLGVATLVQVAITAVTQGVPTLAPFIQADFGLTRAEVALFGSALTLGTVLALAASGWAADIYGERAIMALGSGVVALAACGLALSPTVPVAIIALFLAGLGAATPTPAGSRTVLGWFPPSRRGWAMGLRQTGIPLGGALAAFTLPWVAAFGGWRVAIAVVAAVCACGAAFCWAVYHDAAATLGTSITPSTSRPARVGLRSLITRDIALLAAAGTLLPLGQFCLLTYLALYLFETRGTPVALGASLLVAAHLGGAVGRLAWGYSSDRFFRHQRRPPLLIAGGLAALCAFALGHLPLGLPLWLLAGLVFLFGFSALGWPGNWVALVAELSPPGQQGQVMGTAMTATYLGITAGPPLFGALVDQTGGNWTLAWSALSVILLVGTLHIVPVRERATPL